MCCLSFLKNGLSCLFPCMRKPNTGSSYEGPGAFVVCLSLTPALKKSLARNKLEVEGRVTRMENGDIMLDLTAPKGNRLASHNEPPKKVYDYRRHQQHIKKKISRLEILLTGIDRMLETHKAVKRITEADRIECEKKAKRLGIKKKEKNCPSKSTIRCETKNTRCDTKNLCYEWEQLDHCSHEQVCSDWLNNYAG